MRGHLPVHCVFCQGMFAIGIWVTLPKGSKHLVPETLEHTVDQEILHHCRGQGRISTCAASGVQSPGDTWRPGQNSANAHQVHSSVTTVLPSTSCPHHEEL